MLSIKKKNRLVSFDLIREDGGAINSRTDINVIAEAAGSCLSSDLLLQYGGADRRDTVKQGKHNGTMRVCLRERKRGSS